MNEIRAVTMNGDQRALSSEELSTLDDALDGYLITPQAEHYEESRQIWNGMIDRRPGLIVECVTHDDVARTVRFARERGLLASVCGGGHNIAGNAVIDGTLMISVRGMRQVEVEPSARRVRAQPGALLGDLDQATQAHGLAVPVGINSTTGVAGLTVGGGFGWLSRSWGMTIDSLRSARVITANGDTRTASAEADADLFWAIRGGGGNFGIVTEFEFEAHPVGPEVLSGLIVHPIADAPAVLREYRDYCAGAPDSVSVWCVLRQAPPLPFLPEAVHFQPVLILAALYAGDMSEGERVLAPIRAVGDPIGDVIGPHRYVDFQAGFDPLLTPGARNYWKSHDFEELDDGLLDALVSSVDTIPGFGCEIFIAQMGGATNRVPPDATAYPHRDAEFIMNVHGRWEHASEDEVGIRWCRDLFEATEPYATGGVYSNFMPGDEKSRVRSAYGDNWDRLVELKRRYDPDNFFRFNQNIPPSGA